MKQLLFFITILAVRVTYAQEGVIEVSTIMNSMFFTMR